MPGRRQYGLALQQGRVIHVSPQVLAAIARALQLEPAERAHPFRLAGHAPPALEGASAAISLRLQRVLDAWGPFPAHVSGRRRDVLAWNRASEALNFQVAEQPTLRLSPYTPADDGRSATTLRAVTTARPGLTSGA